MGQCRTGKEERSDALIAFNSDTRGKNPHARIFSHGYAVMDGSGGPSVLHDAPQKL
ncbi:hypothetical protein NE619_04445 [Anaerovorax odorimutans]|uniref:Uncharacterized protein n=1 Tax=Anaerovorax odorimutans TaxID=109327 RepID=A0ABT1RLZ7_9FIRM|nr:hypothetical protein [Anaerovorax odorimutans]